MNLYLSINSGKYLTKLDVDTFHVSNINKLLGKYHNIEYLKRKGLDYMTRVTLVSSNCKSYFNDNGFCILYMNNDKTSNKIIDIDHSNNMKYRRILKLNGILK